MFPIGIWFWEIAFVCGRPCGMTSAMVARTMKKGARTGGPAHLWQERCQSCMSLRKIGGNSRKSGRSSRNGRRASGAACFGFFTQSGKRGRRILRVGSAHAVAIDRIQGIILSSSRSQGLRELSSAGHRFGTVSGRNESLHR